MTVRKNGGKTGDGKFRPGTPDEAGRIMALLTAHKVIIETCDLEARLTALEAKTEDRE